MTGQKTRFVRSQIISRFTGIADLLHERLSVCARLYADVQTCLSNADRLELRACRLPLIRPIQSGHPHIRRLIFLRQFEMLHTLRSMQQMRFDADELPIRIRIVSKSTVDKFNPLWECRIERGEELISKNLTDNVTNASDFRTYPYLISADNSSIRTFPDAVYMDMAIDGIRSHSKLNRCGMAHVQQRGEEQSITIRVKLCGLPLEINRQYYLSERYVDFNTKRAIQALEQATSLTEQILDDPRVLRKPQAIQRASREMQQEISNMFSKREPSIKPEGLHTLNRAQQEACERVKNERVTLIWGPPGKRMDSIQLTNDSKRLHSPRRQANNESRHRTRQRTMLCFTVHRSLAQFSLSLSVLNSALTNPFASPRVPFFQRDWQNLLVKRDCLSNGDVLLVSITYSNHGVYSCRYR